MKNKNSNVKYLVAGPLVVAVILTVVGVSVAQYQGGMGRRFRDQQEKRNYDEGFNDRSFNGGMGGGMGPGLMGPMGPGLMGPPMGSGNFMPPGPGPMMGTQMNPFSFGGRLDERNLSNFSNNSEAACDELDINFDEELANTFSSDCSTIAALGERYENAQEEFENAEEELKSQFEKDEEGYINPKFMREIMKQMRKLEKEYKTKIKSFVKEAKSIKKSVDQKWKTAIKAYKERKRAEEKSMQFDQSQYSQPMNQPMNQPMVQPMGVPMFETGSNGAVTMPVYPDSGTGYSVP